MYLYFCISSLRQCCTVFLHPLGLNFLLVQMHSVESNAQRCFTLRSAGIEWRSRCRYPFWQTFFCCSCSNHRVLRHRWQSQFASYNMKKKKIRFLQARAVHIHSFVTCCLWPFLIFGYVFVFRSNHNSRDIWHADAKRKTKAQPAGRANCDEECDSGLFLHSSCSTGAV